MLVVRCANGFVLWIFRRVDLTTKVAICINDKTRIIYSASQDATWVALIQTMITHSVQLQGAFQSAFQVEV